MFLLSLEIVELEINGSAILVGFPGQKDRCKISFLITEQEAASRVYFFGKVLQRQSTK